MSKMSLLSIPWPFWTGILSQVSKNDDEKTLLLKSNLALAIKYSKSEKQNSGCSEKRILVYSAKFVFPTRATLLGNLCGHCK